MGEKKVMIFIFEAGEANNVYLLLPSDPPPHLMILSNLKKILVAIVI